jgi:hypothetical protein
MCSLQFGNFVLGIICLPITISLFVLVYPFYVALGLHNYCCNRGIIYQIHNIEDSEKQMDMLIAKMVEKERLKVNYKIEHEERIIEYNLVGKLYNEPILSME